MKTIHLYEIGEENGKINLTYFLKLYVDCDIKN